MKKDKMGFSDVINHMAIQDIFGDNEYSEEYNSRFFGKARFRFKTRKSALIVYTLLHHFLFENALTKKNIFELANLTKNQSYRMDFLNIIKALNEQIKQLKGNEFNFEIISEIEEKWYFENIEKLTDLFFKLKFNDAIKLIFIEDTNSIEIIYDSNLISERQEELLANYSLKKHEDVDFLFFPLHVLNQLGELEECFIQIDNIIFFDFDNEIYIQEYCANKIDMPIFFEDLSEMLDSLTEEIKKSFNEIEVEVRKTIQKDITQIDNFDVIQRLLYAKIKPYRYINVLNEDSNGNIDLTVPYYFLEKMRGYRVYVDDFFSEFLKIQLLINKKLASNESKSIIEYDKNFFQQNFQFDSIWDELTSVIKNNDSDFFKEKFITELFDEENIDKNFIELSFLLDIKHYLPILSQTFDIKVHVYHDGKIMYGFSKDKILTDYQSFKFTFNENNFNEKADRINPENKIFLSIFSRIFKKPEILDNTFVLKNPNETLIPLNNKLNLFSFEKINQKIKNDYLYIEEFQENTTPQRICDFCIHKIRKYTVGCQSCNDAEFNINSNLIFKRANK